MSGISIIIPVLNDGAHLLKTLLAIAAEAKGSRTENRTVEVIVVDNGSSDDTVEVATKLGARVLLEHRHLDTPYSARNRGIEAASGDVVVLLDATCVPQPGWLAAGLSALGEQGGIVGGQVRFSFEGERPTASEAYDAMVHIQMAEAITIHRRAMTANLFISRDVFARRGIFREGVRSGEDVRWTSDAARAGERLDYCHKAMVIKPARTRADLIDKVRRTASGAPAFLGRRNSVLAVVRGLLTPPNPHNILGLLRRHFPGDAAALFVPVFLVAWRLRWARATAILSALARS